MRKEYGGLEQRFSRDYKSAGERIIGEVLVDQRFRFSYEPRMYVEEKKENDSEKGRLWYPDFVISDQGIVIEYVGRPEDKNYMAGIEHKRKTYEQMGLKVVTISRDDLFDKERDYKLRRGAKEYILSKINDAIRDKNNTRISYGYIGANLTDKVYREVA